MACSSVTNPSPPAIWLYCARGEHTDGQHLDHPQALAVAQEGQGRRGENRARTCSKRFDLDYEWHGDHIDFERPGVSGQMHVGKDRIKIDVQLGLLLGMLKPTIEREIVAQMDKLLA